MIGRPYISLIAETYGANVPASSVLALIVNVASLFAVGIYGVRFHISKKRQRREEVNSLQEGVTFWLP